VVARYFLPVPAVVRWLPHIPSPVSLSSSGRPTRGRRQPAT
jgi:hypothetical protein